MLRKTSICTGAIALCVTALLGAASPTSVIDAAKNGNRDEVRTLLQGGADVNTALADGMTALHYAALKNDADLARMLLFAGANAKATTRLGGYTPLLLASRAGNASVMQALLDGGADPNGATVNGTTPLMLAAATGKIDAVRLLVDKGADVNAKERAREETAMMFAAANGRADVIRLLATKGADTKSTTRVIDLDKFAKEEQERFAQFLQQQGSRSSQGSESSKGSQGSAGSGVSGAPPAAQTQARGGRGRQTGTAGIDRQYSFPELVGYQGGLSALHIAARQGSVESVQALLEAGADVNQRSSGDHITPIIIATLNGHFDLAKTLLDRGADPNLAEDNGVTPLYAAINCYWAPKALYPQPRAYEQQKLTYLDLMSAFIDKGANPNARLRKKVWYSGYDFDLSGVDEIGATPFWRAAYASDIEAMKLLVAKGADPNIPSMKGAGRPRTGDAQREVEDVAKIPPIPVGGPGVPPVVAAAGSGYGEGFAANSHRYAPTGMLAAVKYLIEELHADVNARDHEGNTALHNAAARGDVEMIKYLVSKGADVKAVNREGKTNADMANGPVQRIQPWPEALTLLESLGAKNNHKCVSC
jgi:ankyrin repeat protein